MTHLKSQKSSKFNENIFYQKKWITAVVLSMKNLFWLFNEGMNGITDAHIVWRA